MKPPRLPLPPAMDLLQARRPFELPPFQPQAALLRWPWSVPPPSTSSHPCGMVTGWFAAKNRRALSRAPAASAGAWLRRKPLPLHDASGVAMLAASAKDPALSEPHWCVKAASAYEPHWCVKPPPLGLFQVAGAPSRCRRFAPPLRSHRSRISPSSRYRRGVVCTCPGSTQQNHTKQWMHRLIKPKVSTTWMTYSRKIENVWSLEEIRWRERGGSVWDITTHVSKLYIIIYKSGHKSHRS